MSFVQTRAISCLILVAVWLTSACRADTSFATGPEWEITRSNGASWAGTNPDQNSTQTLPDGSTATGIFNGNPSNLADTWYRRTFTLSEGTGSAKAYFVTDILFDLLVNDTSVSLSGVTDGNPSSREKDQSPAEGLSLPPELFVLGSNTIVFKTHVNSGGDAGDPFLAARIDIVAPEPASATGVLIAGLTLLSQRRRPIPKKW